ncbi:MAG TPA: S41 family peptidase [Terracidiphilus sp.]|nr:S41 family peptidase [Terracidiphilus sp.]
MFEKIYARLLLLYPAAFREKYRDEAQQLLHDRLRDETGLFSRARLYFDLLVDAAKGLPQAWRNTYAEGDAPSLAPNAEGTPSFRLLEQEKLRPKSVALGSTLAIAALVGFGVLMSMPAPLLPFSKAGGPKSPIESVLERLNRAPSAGTDAGTGGNAVANSTTPGQQNQAGKSGGQAMSPDLIDAEERDRVIHTVASNMLADYFDHQKAVDAADMLLTREKHGDYDAIVHGPDLAARLTADLRGATHDYHLIVEYSRNPIADGPVAPSPAEQEEYRQAMQQENCTIEKVEILPDRIGYFKLNSFPDPQVCGAAASAAMKRLNQADAIVFDLRSNAGGSPEMVAKMSAPLFAQPVPWYNPRTNPTAGTLKPVSGSKLANKPVYILTSTLTFSGAEHFTYNLKMLHRATVIGETTGGAAHSAAFHRIDDHFGMGIQEYPITNPYGGQDWAVVGVEPDVQVKAADALATAEKLARERYPK